MSIPFRTAFKFCSGGSWQQKQNKGQAPSHLKGKFGLGLGQKVSEVEAEGTKRVSAASHVVKIHWLMLLSLFYNNKLNVRKSKIIRRRNILVSKPYSQFVFWKLYCQSNLCCDSLESVKSGELSWFQENQLIRTGRDSGISIITLI